MVRFRMPTTAVIHSEDVFNFVGNFNLRKITDQSAHSSAKSDVVFQSTNKLLGGLHGIHIRDQGALPGMVTPASMVGVTEKMVSVATASFLCGLLKAGNLNLKYFVMGI